MSFTDNDPLILLYVNGSQWEVEVGFRYIIDNQTDVTVPAGFSTDLASVPRLFWNIYPPQGGVNEGGQYGKAAVIHDYLYRYATVRNYTTNILQRVTREQADKIFLQAMKELDVGYFTRHILYSTVVIGGILAWNNWRKINP